MDGGWVGKVYTVPGFPLVNLIILCKSLIFLGIKHLWVFFLFLFMLSNLYLNYHKIFYRQQQESTETVYFHIPSQLGMEITHSLLLEWLPMKWGVAGVPRVGKNGGGKSFNHAKLINTTITSFACLPIMHVLLRMCQFCNEFPHQVWLHNINFV